MDKEWSESRYEPQDGRDDQEDSPLREQYDDLEHVGTDKSSKHRSKDRKNSSQGEDKEHRSKDRDKQKRTMEDVSKEREKEARDLEKDRIGSPERKREDRDEHEKDRSRDSKLKEKDYDRDSIGIKTMRGTKIRRNGVRIRIMRRKGGWRKKLIKGERRRGEKRKLGIGLEKRKGIRRTKGRERGIEIVKRIGKATEIETKIRGRIRFATKKGK